MVECSENVKPDVDTAALLQVLHASIKACPDVNIRRLKSRTIFVPSVISGEAGQELRMIHVTLAVLSGRDVKTRKSFGQVLFAALQAEVGRLDARPISLTVEVREMDRECYFRN